MFLDFWLKNELSKGEEGLKGRFKKLTNYK